MKGQIKHEWPKGRDMTKVCLHCGVTRFYYFGMPRGTYEYTLPITKGVVRSEPRCITREIQADEDLTTT